MAFESLSDKLASVFKKLRGKGKLTEQDIKDAMREVRMALLEADVNYKVAKDFIGALGMQLCTQVSEALRAALPESTPVRVEPSVSADAGVIGAAATVFERSLDALLGSG